MVIIWLMMVNDDLVGGCCYNPSEKCDLVKVSWDSDIPTEWKAIIHSCSSHHQPVNNHHGMICLYGVSICLLKIIPIKYGISVKL